ncbi:MAG: hypothetical protein KAU17_02960 [Spirochaetales bacterium]|nr:hypothetical protein [Spirochaetales bacterium]
MDEFVSRMATQRYVLNRVNSKINSNEELFGLSSNAIERWAITNQLGPKSELVRLLRQVSSELFFMATHSQEPVSAEYELRRQRIVDSVSALENAV